MATSASSEGLAYVPELSDNVCGWTDRYARGGDLKCVRVSVEGVVVDVDG